MLLEYLYIKNRKYIILNAMIYLTYAGLLISDMVNTADRDADESALSSTMYVTMIYTCIIMLREMTHVVNGCK